jgi:hypothetical protein
VNDQQRNDDERSGGYKVVRTGKKESAVAEKYDVGTKQSEHGGEKGRASSTIPRRKRNRRGEQNEDASLQEWAKRRAEECDEQNGDEGDYVGSGFFRTPPPGGENRIRQASVNRCDRAHCTIPVLIDAKIGQPDDSR